MKINGYVDVSNLVHRTINGYFRNIPEIKNARAKKNDFATKEEHNKYVMDIKDKVVKEKGDNLQYLLLSMTFIGFESMRKEFQANEEDHYAMFDSSSWRKDVVKEFYKKIEEEDSTVKESLYKDGRHSPYNELVWLTLSNIEKLLQDLDYNVFKHKGLEADDLIAIIVQMKKEEINKIGSNDIDFYQLQKQKNVTQFNPISKATIDLTTKEANQELQLKIISGDGSDNIPKIFNFQIKDKNGKLLSMPRLGEGTFKGMIEAYDIEIGDDIKQVIDDIAIKIYTYQILSLPIKAKLLKPFKESLKSPIKQEVYENLEENIKQLINTTTEELKIEKVKSETKLEEIKELDSKKEYIYQTLEVLDSKELKANKTDDILTKEIKKNILIDRKLKEIQEYSYPITFEEIQAKLLKQYNHNNKIINFDFIPEDLKTSFVSSLNFKEKTKQGILRKQVFDKYKLIQLSKSVKIDTIDVDEAYGDIIQEEPKSKEQKKEFSIEKREEEFKIEIPLHRFPETQLVTTNGNRYIKISGFIDESPLEKLEGIIHKNKLVSKLELPNEEIAWIIKINDDEENNQKYIRWNNKLLELIKKTSKNIKETNANEKNNKTQKINAINAEK